MMYLSMVKPSMIFWVATSNKPNKKAPVNDGGFFALCGLYNARWCVVLEKSYLTPYCVPSHCTAFTIVACGVAR